MKTSDDSARIRRRMIALVSAGVVLLGLAGIGVYGLLSGPSDTRPGSPSDLVPQVTTVPDRQMPRVPSIIASDDPEQFARSVADALFTWDTASGLFPLDYTAVVLNVGDPTGSEQAGLASDIASYLPSRDAWVELRQYSTRQHLGITEAYVPGQWADAVAQALPGQLPVGATAITIEGTRHRSGLWNDEPVASEHPVSFTIFLVCPPEPQASTAVTTAPATRPGPSCYVLRLSLLDTPLR